MTKKIISIDKLISKKLSKLAEDVLKHAALKQDKKLSLDYKKVRILVKYRSDFIKALKSI